MASRTQSAFQTIRTEGALLPADLLKRIADGDKSLDGLTAQDYNLDPAERINEVTNRAWTACCEAWQRFQKQRSELPESDKGTTLTRDRWLLKLFQELGYGRLQTAKAVEIDGKSYAVSHIWNNVPVHLTSFRYDLDHPVKDVVRVSAHSLVQELLNRDDNSLWGFVSNGLQLRILRDNVSFTRAAYVEFDLEDMMEGEVYSDFVLLWLLCHESRLEADKDKQCWLEKWHQAAKQQGTRALDRLRDGVQKAIEVFGQGFLAHRANASLRAKLADGSLTTQQYYQQLLRLVYRLIFLFVAEDRNLLLLSTTDDKTRERYEKHYALNRIRRLAERRRGTRHADLWQGIRVIFGLLYKGDPRLGLPALGSMLFSGKAMPDLNGCELANDALLEAVRQLAFTQDGKVLRQVDYRNLGSEELGSVYESLLELHPDVNADAAKFELATVAGSERKTTGSYYTPSSLINCLLDSALNPVVDEAIKAARERAKSSKGNPAIEIEKAILNLKVCDPACGSGHFLIAAANRLAHRLATVRTGNDEPSPAARRAAFRDVVGRCIYGVDINPMAVELCKVALWLESLDPGRPLSFLDHRILCGNSLIGATPRLIGEGLPDDAFQPVEGDDKAVCGEYKRRNKDERRGQAQFDWGDVTASSTGNLIETFAGVVAVQDDSLQAVETKEQRYDDFVKSVPYEKACLLADAWCAAFVWKKDRSTSDCMTTQWIRRIEANPNSLPQWMRHETTRLREQYQFFHWHIAFPDVFGTGTSNKTPENERADYSGGFDLILGNPPWEMVQAQDLDFFRNMPEISGSRTRAQRQRAIRDLDANNRGLVLSYQHYLRLIAGQRHYLDNSQRYALSTVGRINTYKVFLELGWSLLSRFGLLGMIVPSGIATDDFSAAFFADMMGSRSLITLYDFENRGGLFADVHRSMRFCILTLAARHGIRRQHAEFAFFLHQTTELNDSSRRFYLTIDDLALLNPNTQTAAIFRSLRDAELCKRVYRTHHIFVRATAAGDTRLWDVQFGRIFNLGHEGDAFTSVDSLSSDERRARDWLPLYEGKMFDAYDHRAASVRYNPTNRTRPFQACDSIAVDLNNPYYSVRSQFYIERHQVVKRISPQWSQPWLICAKDVTAATNERTVVAAILPLVATSYSVRTILGRPLSGTYSACLLANLNSFCYDWLIRQFLGGLHLQDSITHQCPMIAPTKYKERAAWFPAEPLCSWIAARVLELTYVAWDLEAFARDCSWHGPPFRWDENRRYLLRCELDAALFHLYMLAAENGAWRVANSAVGAVLDETPEQLDALTEYFLTPRNAVEYILEAFPIIKRKDEAAHGCYRTKDVILGIYDAMAEAIRTGKPYQTRLDPPPGPPVNPDGSFAALPEWKAGAARPNGWLSHIHPPREVSIDGR